MRSTTLALLTLLVGIAVGAAIGFVVGDGAPKVDASSAVVGRSIDRRPVERGASGSDPLVSVSSRPMSEGGGTSSATDRVLDGQARAASSDIADRVAASLSGDLEGADAVLRGRVVAEDGSPLVGVTVVTEGGGDDGGGQGNVRGQSTNDVGRGWTGPDSIDDNLQWRARRFLEERRTLRTAETDAQGEFELTGLRPGQHRLQAYLDGYVFDSDRFHTGQRGWLVGRPVGLFHLDLRLPDGSQPEEAVVDLVDDRDVYRWTPEEPVLRLEEHLATFRALAGDVQQLDRNEYASNHVSRELTIDLRRDGEGPHVLQLEERNILRITVLDESGIQPPLDPWVKVASASQIEGRDPAKAFDGIRGVEQTEDESAWIRTDLAPGSYSVAVGRSTGVPEVVDTIQVVAGVNEHEIVLGGLDLGRFLVVRCAGPQGQPLNEVDFDRRVRFENGGDDGGTRSEDRGPGEYWLPLDSLLEDRDWSEIEQLTLVAEADGYGTLTTEVPTGAESISLTFEPSCDLTVVVEGDTSPGFSVSAAQLTEDENRNRFGWGGESATVDGTGRARIRGLQPGAVRVYLRRDGGRRWSPPIAVQDVQLRGGDQQVAFVAPTLHQVVVLASDLRPRTRMNLRPDGDEFGFGGAEARVNEEGVALFEDVAAGRYLLSVRGRNQAPMAVTVPSGEIVYEVEVIDAFAVTNVEGGGLADRAGLQNGDVVFAINGRNVDPETFYDRLRLYLEDGAITLSVDRGNGSAEVRIGPLTEGRGSAWDQLGVRFEPRAR